MKILTIFGVCILTIAGGIAQDQALEVKAVPRFATIDDWLTFVRRDDFDLLKSSDQNGYFFGVFRDSHGDVAICYYWKARDQKRPSRGSYGVTDLEGKSLYDRTSKRKLSVIRKLVIKEPHEVILWDDGVVCPLVDDLPKRVRVTYSSGGDDGPMKVVFDEVVELAGQQPQAEQVGAGQPATRSESKSEGSDKPQPEAEGRSR